MFLHIVHISFGALILLVGEGNGEAGFYVLCFHNESVFNFFFQLLCHLNLMANLKENLKLNYIVLPAIGQFCSVMATP